MEQEYQTRSSQLPQTIEAELAATRYEGPTDPVPPLQSVARELGVLNKLTERKTAEFHSKTATANAFYGGDPFNRHINEFMIKATKIEKWPGPDGIAMQSLNQSLRAAIEARLLSQTLQSLHQRTVNLQHTLNAMQATEQARLAAEQEAQRVAAERARIEAEQQRQRDIADAAHRERVAFFARERARFVALHEARRPAKEQAQTAAEAAARQVAAEQARLEAQADPLHRAAEADAEKSRIERAHRTQKEQRERQRENALRTERDVYRQQAEKNRRERLIQAVLEAQENRRQQALLDAQAEPERLAELARLTARRQAQTEARWENPVFAHYGSMAAFGPTFTGTLGTVGVSPATSLALRTALRAAVSAAIAALASTATPVLVGFAALLAPSRLGNGDLFSVSVPLSELAPDSTADLYELAAVGGEIDLPVRLGSRTIGNSVEIVVVATDGVTVPASVPVRLAHFDARKNVYVSGSTVSNGPVITWTPLIEPQDPSTEFPLIDTDLPIYEGATVTPDAGRIDPFPELDRYGFGGFITVFPIDSGIPPTFTMFRDRRQDPGVAIGSGQSVSGNWLGAASTLEGAPIPKQIADKLRGREFSSFKAFRRVFWKAVANDPFLIDQFTQLNKTDVRDGLSPSALPSEQVGGRKKFEIHHIEPISEGGAVYDIDNLRILAPKQHIETHSRKGEM
ncbi:S-type pyocin domain-containing protein [Pseudomonas sp. ANT_J28]|uniref:S-type pyocin domain-containing protein n=1 Tax=Pseudomonas sp. ANT_J28 TaxID=2597352 RepID=UPI002115BFE6|nr:S-type pyocin domain-containing protein [Pseudomonas sp. ANT_J28]